MTKEEVCKKYNITGCEHCPYFVEVDTPWRQYCAKGNFNINSSSYEVKQTSHNKNKCVIQDRYEWEYAIPNRCPLLKDKNIKE